MEYKTEMSETTNDQEVEGLMCKGDGGSGAEVDCELLIELVRSFPILWNTQCFHCGHAKGRHRFQSVSDTFTDTSKIVQIAGKALLKLI